MPFPDDWVDARQFEFTQGDVFERDGVEWLNKNLKQGDDAQLDLAVKEYRERKFNGLCDGYSFCWMRAKLNDSANDLHTNSDRAQELYKTDNLATVLKAHLWFAGSKADRSGPSTRDGAGKYIHEEWAHADSDAKNSMTYETAVDAKDRIALIGQIKDTAGRCTELDFPAKSGRHSIAFYRSHGSSVYMFDSNFGEFKVPKNQLESIVGSLFDHYGTTDEVLGFNKNLDDTKLGYGLTYKLRIWTLATPLTKGRMLTKKRYGV